MNWTLYSSFDAIPSNILYNVLKMRQDVFIIEQNCIYEDIDNLDRVCEHLVLAAGDSIAAYARIVPAGVKYQEVSIGRIVVNPDYRGRGLGKNTVQKSLEILIRKKIPVVRIEAQAHLKKFYENLGFSKDSEIYELDGILHLEMLQQLHTG
jgi:ElaA protein